MLYIHSNVQNLHITKPLGITIGNFDGLHLGHQKLLLNLIKFTKKRNFSSCLISFNPHPIAYFKKDKNFLIDLEQTKIELLEKMGLDFYVSIIFEEQISNFTNEEFESRVLSSCLNTKLILSGLDFKYGKNRSGNISTLKNFSLKNDIDFHTEEEVIAENFPNKISSTTIRNLIREGNVQLANKMLGRKFEIIGTVIKGDQRGRTIGVPTANLQYNDLQVELSKGVYAVRVILNNEIYSGISNYGIRPTFNQNIPLVEVHIFDFNDDIYDKEIKVQFQEKIREEIKFEGIEELLKQIKTDISMARDILKNGN
ncbi:MAG: riboflavin biosynthesis protein RibF [Proteobacteria bacterium]|nr:riboflavin biosynthesis protein RibF [Pseudomonadota bacterium]